LKENEIIVINAILSEHKGDYNSALREYEKLENPGIYILSRMLNLLEKNGDLESGSRIEKKISDWKGTPNHNFALSILNKN
ncbi:MAG: hypothetical protein R3250_03605, partial [Melioribacteraceae bacterium]|nr:hypothetical protein [Melioribacteraceae bacterium]